MNVLTTFGQGSLNYFYFRTFPDQNDLFPAGRDLNARQTKWNRSGVKVQWTRQCDRSWGTAPEAEDGHRNGTNDGKKEAAGPGPEKT